MIAQLLDYRTFQNYCKNPNIEAENVSRLKDRTVNICKEPREISGFP